MREENLLNDEALKLISGGVLNPGWDDTLRMMMSMYKRKYGEGGKEKIIDMMREHGLGADSKLVPEDLAVIEDFINNNWDAVPEKRYPGMNN